jgi:hypothetical protein
MVIKPVVMYTSEMWVLKEKEIRMLSIYGAKKEGKEWKVRNSQELRNMYGQDNWT